MSAVMDRLTNMDITVPLVVPTVIPLVQDVLTLWVDLCASVTLGTSSLIEVASLQLVKV